MEDKFKKNLTIDEFGEFAQHFPTGNISVVDLHRAPKFLTTSEDLPQKTILVTLVSGALVGMGFYVFRYDKDDEIIGKPINVDRYIINDNLGLFQRPLPVSEHRLASGSFVLIREQLNNL